MPQFIIPMFSSKVFFCERVNEIGFFNETKQVGISVIEWRTAKAKLFLYYLAITT